MRKITANVREPSRTLDTSEESSNEEGIDAQVKQFSKHDSLRVLSVVWCSVKRAEGVRESKAASAVCGSRESQDATGAGKPSLSA